MQLALEIFCLCHLNGLGIPWQIFPINIKGIGGSLVVLVNWSGAWLVSYTFNFLMNWSSSGKYHFPMQGSQKLALSN